MGSYSPPAPAAVAGSILKELSYNDVSVVEIPAGRQDSNPVILAQWDIILSGESDPDFISNLYAAVVAQGRRTAGGNQVRIGFTQSFDAGSSWSGISSMVYTNAGFVANILSNRTDMFDQGPDAIAIAAWNGDATTAGEVKAVGALIRALFAPGNTVTQSI